MDKFKLFKTKRFSVALKHGIPVDKVIKRTLPFSFKLDCGCIDEYSAGYYTFTCLFGYEKLDDL